MVESVRRIGHCGRAIGADVGQCRCGRASGGEGLESNANEYAESIGVLWPGWLCGRSESKECERSEGDAKVVDQKSQMYICCLRTEAAKNWRIRRKSRQAKQIVVPLQDLSIISGFTRCVTRGYSPFVPLTSWTIIALVRPIRR